MECVQLMDDIHGVASDPRHTKRSLPSISQGLFSIRCEADADGCTLDFRTPGQTSLLAGGKSSRDFEQIARATGTDKVTVHSYHTLYQSVLGSLSAQVDKPFGLVEIGFATGSGSKAFHQFLPGAEMHSFEIGCDQDWNVEYTAPHGVDKTQKHR